MSKGAVRKLLHYYNISPNWAPNSILIIRSQYPKALNRIANLARSSAPQRAEWKAADAPRTGDHGV